MTPKQYIIDALRTESIDIEDIRNRLLSKSTVRLLHAAIGMQTESGEFIDALKKHIYYGKTLDVVNLKEEVGDLMWYIAIACDVLGVSLSDIMGDNIKKLRKRYPEKFSYSDALNRNVENELTHYSELNNDNKQRGK